MSAQSTAPSARPSHSLWTDTADLPTAPPLPGPQQAEVVVVGAGIAGLSAALALAEARLDVVVVERDQPGQGETARTTAHLASAWDDRYTQLIASWDEATARRVARSQQDAIDQIERWVETYAINCDFRRLDGYLFPAPDDTDFAQLRAELEASQRAGLAVEWVEQAPASLGLTGVPAIRYAQQARFHPMRYLAGLVAAIQQRGGRVYGQARVAEVRETDTGVILRTEAGVELTGHHAVIATNTPISERIHIHTKQAPYRTYVIAYHIPADAVADALIWDDADPYHYVRLQEHPTDPSQQLLISGGADHKAGQGDADDSFADLDAWTRRYFPVHAEYTRWSGMVQEPADSLPFAGLARGERFTWLITGDSGQGMTNATIGGRIVADGIRNLPNDYAELFAPARLMTRALGTYAKENLNVASTFADYLRPGEVAAADSLPPGEGAIVREGLRKVAAYRAPDGTLHRRSAVCTHVGCQVHWNGQEHLWECPCHGSRFSPTGEVLGGPATAPLASLED